MDCPHCRSASATRRTHGTTLGYPRFKCRACDRRFNERTSTPFNDLQYPTNLVLLAVLWRLRHKLSFRDVAELLLQRGYGVAHETILDWEFRFAPLLADQLRAKQRGRAGGSWLRGSKTPSDPVCQIGYVHDLVFVPHRCGCRGYDRRQARPG